MAIRIACIDDLPAILDIYAGARAFMRRTGNMTQWADGYPREEVLREDIRRGELHVLEDGGDVQAVFLFVTGPDPTYADIDGAWLNDEPYYVVHRIAAREGSHAGRRCLAWACDKDLDVRIDTHEDNGPMRGLLSWMGFVECGVIICDDGTPRIAYQHERD